MSVRALGAFAVLAIAGVAGGYGVSALQTDAPLTISVAAPVPAASPSYPVTEYDVEPDPDDAPLATGLPLEAAKLRANGKRLEFGVPEGWSRGGDLPNAIFTADRSATNTYQLRVTGLGGLSSQRVEVMNRINALRDAEANEQLENLVIETQGDDRFVATYLQGGYRRVSMERFLVLGDSGATAAVAAVGREADRDGLQDLLTRVSDSLRLG
ncbi:hypothetical protein [Nocardioides lianchengensis]|uniref:Uncharacterized protein n=1 Tax=Nocardioides lianchengensis TaxID=1045774 RepID=A0A1G6KWP2_9ACTN|nr:hypothetical protein [Nocardioides lianchengensis]NYG13723.1 hypothetical protein [Nocardioides lianchengensis]SDC35377.1 hypothetical protein SAMN05421872_10228 [Nocardioides lianchengensis]